MENFCAKIYCGLRKSYSGKVFNIEMAEKICQDYVDKIGWCVTVTKTRYIYKNGNEDGVIVGIIQYPRFPKPEHCIKEQTFKLAKNLLKGLEQNRVSVEINQEIFLIEN